MRDLKEFNCKDFAHGRSPFEFMVHINSMRVRITHLHEQRRQIHSDLRYSISSNSLPLRLSSEHRQSTTKNRFANTKHKSNNCLYHHIQTTTKYSSSFHHLHIRLWPLRRHQKPNRPIRLITGPLSKNLQSLLRLITEFWINSDHMVLEQLRQAKQNIR